MSYKLIALDLDGTLLDDKKQITDSSRRLIREARNAGLRVMLASGRHASLVEPFASELELDLPFVSNNGCEIWHTDGSLLQRTGLGPEDMKLIRSLSAEFGLPCYSYAADGIYTASNFPSDPDACRWLMALIRCPDPAVLSCVDGLLRRTGRFELSMSGDYKLDINPPGISKARGVEFVSRLLGIEAAEVVAIGDSPNDMSMLQWAGLGIAMDNAADEVKACADRLTASNREDGVARAIERILLGQA